ncbi:MAG: flavin reductase family protein [Rhodothermales bacterium]
MRRVPAAVTVVTAFDGAEMRGMTVGSFTSVSLNPLLVSFNVGKASSMYGVLLGADYFYVHLLSEEQSELSNLFAQPDLAPDKQFEHVAHFLAPDGAPILEDTLAFIRCEKIVVYDAGDHCLMIGRVEEIIQQRDGLPLIYFDRGYRRLGGDVMHSQIVDVPSEE